MGKIAIALVGFIAGVVITAACMHLWMRPTQTGADALRTWLQRDPEFLADHYELVSAAERIVRSRELQNDVRWRKQLVADRWLTYLDPAFAPSLGARSASTVLVEFTDYACEPCRASAAAVKHTVETLPELRVALFILPTSGDLSEYAARVAFAGYRQNPERFATLHDRLLNISGPLTSAGILHAAQDAGLDTNQIEVDLRSGEVRQYVARARQFAQDLHVAGVPYFLLDGRMLAGGVSEAKLKSFVGRAPGTVVLTDTPMPSMASR
jgi:hypothetical protein